MDDRLAAIMRQTGDSWDIKATTGDLDLGSPAAGSNNPRTWACRSPARQPARSKEVKKGKAKAGKRAKRQKAGAASGKDADQE